MMKLFILIMALTASVSCYAQKKLLSYTASNGITYNVGDTVKLGYGTGLNGKFIFMNLGGALFDGSDKDSMADRRYSNTASVIKKIFYEKFNNTEKITFLVPSQELSNYRILIEDAINVGEVIPGKVNSISPFSVADEIVKLKGLLDAGTITQSEFDGEKKKLLDIKIVN